MASYVPTMEEFVRLAGEGYNLIPVYREVVADLETPVSAYLKIAGHADAGTSFLLESVEGGEHLARFSFMGMEPYRVLRTGPGQPDGANDPLLAIEAELARFRPAQVEGLPPFVGGAVGYLSYETVHYFEPRAAIATDDPPGAPGGGLPVHGLALGVRPCQAPDTGRRYGARRGFGGRGVRTGGAARG